MTTIKQTNKLSNEHSGGNRVHTKLDVKDDNALDNRS